MLSRDRVQPTRISVALVARKGQPAPSHGEPAQSVLVDVNDESHSPSITSGSSCRIDILELHFEASAEQARDAAGFRFPISQ
jgi:hypothetical protein